MVTVKITETYDLKTTKDTIGLIGIHTPTKALVNQLYPGLVKNHRFIRCVSCDVVGACASVLPADPLQVGTTEGDVAPEDMFNPILYKAVTNESFNLLVNRIYDAGQIGNLGSVDATSFFRSGAAGTPNAFDVYYALLSAGEWRHAMPQSGFRISKLVPIAHELLSSFGQVAIPSQTPVLGEDGETPVMVNDDNAVNVVNESLTAVSSDRDALTFRGRSVRMPRLPLHYGVEANSDASNFLIPKTFVAAIITPPARLNEFFYRMRVTWTLSFEEVASTLAIRTAVGHRDVSGVSYYKGYSYTSAKGLDTECDSVDTSESVQIKKIMEA